MKKLLTALALCASTAAFAADTRNVPAKDPAAPSAKQMEGRETGIDATEVGPGIRDAPTNAAQTVGLATEEQGTFKTDKAYDIEGILKKTALGGAVTIERKGLPAASLDLRDNTTIMLDGKKAAMNQLLEGQKVRAKFQIEGEEVVALRLEAMSDKAARPMKKR